MNLRALCATALFAAGAMALPAVGAPVENATSQSGTLPHGGSYMIYRDPTIGAAAIDLWFRAPGAGYANNAPGISRLAATAAAAARLESGRSLAEFVRSVGGRLSINAYPDIVGISVIVPSSAASRTVASMTAAFFSPLIDDNALKTAQRDSAVLAVQQRYSSDSTLHNALFAEVFSSGPAHLTPLPSSVSDITRVQLDDVTAFAKRAFRSSNAFLTLAGDVDASSVGVVTNGSGNGSPDNPFDSTVAASPKGDSTISGNVAGIGLAWVGPAIHDERAATAMDFVADYLFRDETGLISKSLNSSDDSYVDGQFITLHDPGVMLVTIGGSKDDNVRAQVLAAVNKLTQPMDPKPFAAAREAFLYHLASDMQLPGQQADNLGWYAAEGNASYAPGDSSGTYWKNAQTLDPAFVASVVKQYLSHPIVVRLLATAKESSS